MSILSVYFLIFLFLLTIVYYIVPNKAKPAIILIGNIYFYLQFDARYSLFLLFSVITVYTGALLIEKFEKFKKSILGLVLFFNIGLLFYVKFIPYILTEAQQFLSFNPSGIIESIIVPVGIAFYTLQVCGYIIDVFRGKYEAEKNFLKFFAFSTFFPLMLQGPISRFDQLAHQVYNKKKRTEIYHNYTYGAQLMLWGFFKKLVIADRVALLVNEVFDNYANYSGWTVVVAVLFYTIQIYTDFSGCVDICRGAAKLFGIDIIENFKQPYFSKSTQDFWRRWHIALSSWFRDYLYISLGGNRKGKIRKYLNIPTVFFVSGLWHGVGVHYIVWGLMQGVFQIVGALTLPFKEKICNKLKIDRNYGIPLFLQWVATFGLINLSWLMFRASNVKAAVSMFMSIFAFTPITGGLPQLKAADLVIIVISLLIILVVSCYREKGVCVRDKLAKMYLPVRWLVFLFLFTAVLIFGIYGPGFSDAAFIYMNF